MNRKFEDKLAQLAFGDLNADEAARVEAQAMANPDSVVALDAFREIRSGLNDLADIPEDQLSKERLRDAILAQGLNPRAVRSNPLGWLWMPATAFSITAMVMVMRPPVSAPVVALNPNPMTSERVALEVPPSISMNSDLNASVGVLDFKPGGHDFSVTPVAVVTPERPRPTRHHTPKIARADAPEYMLLTSSPVISTGDTVVASNSKPVSGGNEDVWSHPAATSGGDTASTPIVLIDDNKSDQTGAFRAKEVGATNVIVGG